LVGLLAVALGALYLVPRLRAAAGSPVSVGPAATGRDGFAPPSERIDPPLSDTDRMRKEIDRQRVPFFHMIHEKYGDQVERASVINAIDTLDLVIKSEDPQNIQWIVQQAIGPTARQYGFEKVKFYVRNPVGTVEPFRVVAESAWDGASRWNTFLK
jgi:hypothetical protein